MIVTFVSQCEKKSLNKTRRVLDAFANRIGSRTWQTPITEEGLQAVKKLLRKTASKNTAVSCHRIKTRRRVELEWIVGNRDKFNFAGHVPVNQTRKDLIKSEWENDWDYLPLIKALTALAALFHDWGKASKLFQDKLKPKSKNKFKGDPLRHEWISTLFLNAYIGDDTDEQWLGRLASGVFDVKSLKETAMENKKKPLIELPKAASLIAWLIISHHKLPTNMNKDYRGEVAATLERTFKRIGQEWGYENNYDEVNFYKNLPLCFEYPNGLPNKSAQWLKRVKKWAKRLMEELNNLDKAFETNVWRPILLYSRLSLMLGDHFYSSLDSGDKKRLNFNELNLFANTDRNGELKQSLDEHLCGVAEQAIRNTHKLPFFEGTNSHWYAYDIKALKKKSTGDFLWQEKAVAKIKNWINESESKIDKHNFGFFAVNMASTGKGKTFANAKIMRELSHDGGSLRYILALGLRTLTLQTGDEYRDRIGLDDTELAVLIGSKAVMSLHNQKDAEDEVEQSERGSESIESLLSNELIFDALVPESGLDTVLRKQKDRKFLYAPVLSCTIDHIMSATETKKGGRYILPILRLMSSDLVIDEIDDFNGDDLIAIGRLIHLAGMLGRKVMISSATIPPDLARGYFNAYQEGWSIFAQMRNKNRTIGCAWIDEFNTKVEKVSKFEDYQLLHEQFINKRIKNLVKDIVKRKAQIKVCDVNTREEYFSIIKDAIFENHDNHYFHNKEYGKNISIGVVRIANINPCIELTRYLLNIDLPEDTEIKTMAYHSQQVLIMRNAQEKHLDDVLKRGENKCPTGNVVIKQHLVNTKAKNIIFVLVATPVEEVGRDHDFDWAVIEPSSYRSFIQLAGRVLRHRDKLIKKPNITIMQYNIKAIEKNEVVFCRPGYETSENKLATHDVNELVDTNIIAEKLDATARVFRKKELNPKTSLSDLEHHVIQQLLCSFDEQGPESMQAWLTSCWWLTGMPQKYVKFRKSSPQIILYLILNKGEWCFVEKDLKGNINIKEQRNNIKRKELSSAEKQRLWLQRDYKKLLEKSPKGSNIEKAALIYGEISLSVFENKDDTSFTYIEQLGMYRGIF